MDDLDDLLNPKPLPAEPRQVAEVVFAEAVRVQRRRRSLRRGRRIALLAACYTAGLASMWYRAQRREPPAPAAVTDAAQVGPASRAGPDPLRGYPAARLAAPPSDPYRSDPPERLEKWAFVQTGEKRAELYRRAGDGYLRRDDVQAALRCYRRALDAGSAEDLAIHAEKDSWLLMSLKMARQKERPDARVN